MSKDTLNYYYGEGRFEVYWGDVLVVELPHAEPNMTEEECDALANELWAEYLESNEGVKP
jgi:hypothetical protein